MPRARPRQATMDEVTITRGRTWAVIAFRDTSVGTTNLELGADVHAMTDAEILEAYNQTVRAMEALAAAYEHIAVEIPVGRPQLRFHARSAQWVSRGEVLRCYIDDSGPDGEPEIEIDEHRLSLDEFGQLLTTWAGWGMRLVFVPDDELHLLPRIETREPDDEWEG